jgi:hypothetical protein
MATATALGLLGPLAFLAAIVLNAALLWRASPRLLQALAGVRPTLVPAMIRPEGESNIVPLRPRVSPAVAASPRHRLAA